MHLSASECVSDGLPHCMQELLDESKRLRYVLPCMQVLTTARHPHSPQELLDESKRLRYERDAATEREKALKKGLATVREERTALAASLATSQAEAQRAVSGTLEEGALRRTVATLQAERDGLARR